MSACVYELKPSSLVSRSSAGRLFTGVLMNRYSNDCVMATRCGTSGPVKVSLGVAAPNPAIVPPRSRQRGTTF